MDNTDYDIIDCFTKNKSFTQGFYYYKNFLYESTGLYGKSIIRKLEKDRIIKEKKLDDNYFGESITIFDNMIYQLTWKSKIGFIYDMNFNVIKKFNFNTYTKQGWGITHNKNNIIVSDGSHYLYFWNKKTLLEEFRIPIYYNGSKLNNINDLQVHDDCIIANIWKTNNIVKIDFEGNVIKMYNLSYLVDQIDIIDSDTVLNGIASDGKYLYVTGKNFGKVWKILIF